MTNLVARPKADAAFDADIIETETVTDDTVETATVVDADEGVVGATTEAVVVASEPPREGDTAPTESSGEFETAPNVVWVPNPAQSRRKKRLRRTLWIGLPTFAAVVALVGASLILIAPGTAVAGVPMGFLTIGAATEAIEQRLADTTVVLSGNSAELTGAELGASVDARALAEQVFNDHPGWNLTSWFSEPIDATVSLDPEVATSALRAAAPELYVDPVDATVSYDPATTTFVSSSSEPGQGIDVEAVRASLTDAFAAGTSRVEIDPVVAAVDAPTDTTAANETVSQLNGMLDAIGFYVGDQRTVPVDRNVAASWLTVTNPEPGAFMITADQAAIQKAVDTLPQAVNRDPINAKVITDSGGKVLRDEVAGVTGRELGSTDGLAESAAEQLSNGESKFELAVTETAFATTALERRIEVDLGRQRTLLYENGTVVQSYSISSGAGQYPTDQGNFRIYAKVRLQDLVGDDYVTENVPWLSYYNGDEAFHGTYWHNNFGTPMSHGCVNMPINVAKYVFEWAPVGTEVWVHA